MGVILYIGGFELPDKNAAAHRVLSNAKILKQNDKEVVFIGVNKTLKYGTDILQTKQDVQGFESYEVAYPNGKKEWIDYLTKIENYIKIIENLENVDSVIMYNFQAIAMGRLLEYCKKNDIKCYADVTEWRSAKGESLIYRILKDSDTWYRMNILHKKMDGLIVISKYLEQYYCKCNNVVYIPTLTDTSEDKWINTYTKEKNFLKLVYAGNPGRKDRLDKLVEALDQVNVQYRLDIIGITYEQYLKYYPGHKTMLDNNKSIVFHGRLTHLETIDYVKKANYSCFLREDDRVSKAGFPTKFAESISCGTPVLTNKTSNISEYFSRNENGVCINSFDPSVISEVINNLPFEMTVRRDLFDYRNYNASISNFFD
ncbi:glycosyltransferase [Enterococcus cecorum]|uniref:glycosyltransferase n=1 Tax=Enterococcus cecorum TaxID=44008 RepID=UPI003F917523